MLGWPMAAAAVAAVGLASFAAMSIKLAGFARLMHCIIEAVAKPAGLIPVEPKADARAALAAPATA
jgi:hypothetical protein